MNDLTESESKRLKDALAASVVLCETLDTIRLPYSESVLALAFTMSETIISAVERDAIELDNSLSLIDAVSSMVKNDVISHFASHDRQGN